MSGRELEEAVYIATRAALGEAPLATSALVKAVIDRSLRYTSERERLATPANKTGDLAARAAFFTIADAMKIGVPLGELRQRGALPVHRPLRVIDLGAGCGAMTLGLITTLASLGAPSEPVALPLALTITAIDHDAAALAIMAQAVPELARRRGLPVTLATRIEDATRATLGDADLVIMGTLLNEVPAPARLAIVERALAAVGDDGAVIIIEPALRDTSRALHELRDALLERGAAHVFAPCTRALAPCPALADPSDWCHEHRTLALPPRTAEIARLTHLRDDGMKFSYLVLRRGALPLVEEPGAWRVVGLPRTQKGKVEVIGCSVRGRIPLRLLRRNRTDDNRELERADRGDVLIVSPAPAADDAGPPERIEIEQTTRVVRKKPASEP